MQSPIVPPSLAHSGILDPFKKARRIMAKSPLRWSKASGSTRRRVEKFIKLGERTVKRRLSALNRRDFAERLENDR